ncbi:MAG: TetR/AcrR family transcriptional regulator [Candidatus Velamenicoccus archaeovorus]
MSAAATRSEHRPAGAVEPRPGRRRDPGRDRAILDAALDLLAEKGYEAMSMEDVAHRAGVGKPTIYRRWPSKRELVMEALRRVPSSATSFTEGTVRERLTRMAEEMPRAIRRRQAAGLLSSLVGEMHRSPELAEVVRAAFVEKRRRTTLALLREGVERGELRPETDVELAADLLIGPLFSRALLTGGKLSPQLARRIVDVVFDGYGTGPRSEPGNRARRASRASR